MKLTTASGGTVAATTGVIMTARVTVRYFAGARAAAGTGEELVTLPDGATLQTLVDAISHQHGAGLARVLVACTFLVDEVAAGRDRTLSGDVQVDVLPPFAGG